MQNKKISFIVFVYNHENYIEESLDSIENQSIPVYELIISDDASTDDSKNKINDFIKRSKIKNIIYINNSKNIGLIKSVNLCLQKTNGDIVLLQAGDDASHPNRAKITEMYFSKTDCNVLYGSYQIIDTNSTVLKNKIRNSKYTDPIDFIKKGAAVPPYGTAFNSYFLSHLGLIDEKLKNEDDYIGMAAVLHGGLLVIPDLVYKYRIHEKSLSSWNNLKIDSVVYLNRYFSDQLNRIENLKAWRFLIENESIRAKDDSSEIFWRRRMELIDKKINIKKCIIDLRELNLIDRLKVLNNNYGSANKQDFVILIMGVYGVLLINWVRRKLLSVR